ncbi:hypothetical protein [Paenibacillus sp. FSL H8-0537]|uniref:hypothetical protein n=1 Tax=Paenibacillus sp. FSL H8-0537 TaxID=2921399 RepID=UPI003100BA8E
MRKRRDAFKWAIIGGVLVFVILYGIEMSSSGIERIYGPIEETGASSVMPADAIIRQGAETGVSGTAVPETQSIAGMSDAASRKISELERELAEVRELAEQNALYGDRLPGMPYENQEPSVNKLADGTAGLLQSFSTGSMEFIVDLFEKVTK